ncbi:pirin family protein [Brevibacillus sp. SYP-B805]|uniref:pirin family protein n=1 Tax=Brevibacillus sp. SYP-B805 TaxID=1578199 RepID=UPI0013EA693F|nr:pirin family protein [Brevibacillus sp. SYP-B805]NGQ94500.1 pirin family protein [Brevibacillus sp. SYP-B805]
MITIYPAESRFAADHGWLRSNFSFSFAEYYDPHNLQFGPLRVFNDDVVQPLRGFGPHPHREMEIVSVVLQGEIKHEDSMGNSAILRPGEVQRMTAGTGIIHSEVNPSSTEELHFLQLWFLPNQQGLPPSYEQKAYDQSAMKNQLLPVVSGQPSSANTVFIHQDLTLYLSELEAGKTLRFTQQANRRIYIFVIEGELVLNRDSRLGKRDAARITAIADLELATPAGATFMLIDLP